MYLIPSDLERDKTKLLRREKEQWTQRGNRQRGKRARRDQPPRSHHPDLRGVGAKTTITGIVDDASSPPSPPQPKGCSTLIEAPCMRASRCVRCPRSRGLGRCF